jgi:quinone-modifying oxidoreductase subunit QmoC
MGLTEPWKLLANLAGIALIIGCCLMMLDRAKRRTQPNLRSRPAGTYADWLLLVLLPAVALTGFMTEALHLARLDTERYFAYLVHLATVLTFFLLLPYSKLAHVGFRAIAYVCAERFGGRWPARPTNKSTSGAA